MYLNFNLFLTMVIPRARQKPLKHQLALFCGLALFVFLLVVKHMFPCKHCPKKFVVVSSRGLRQHQNKCDAYLRHEAEAAEHRRSASVLSKTKRSRLANRKARIHAHSEAVSHDSTSRRLVIYPFVQPETISGTSHMEFADLNNPEIQYGDQHSMTPQDTDVPIPSNGPSGSLPLPVLEPTLPLPLPPPPPPPLLTQSGWPM